MGARAGIKTWAPRCVGHVRTRRHMLNRSVRKESWNLLEANTNEIAATIFNSISDGVFTTDRECLRRNYGNRAETARELGIHRSTLWRKIREFGLDTNGRS